MRVSILMLLLLAGGCRSPSETLVPEQLPYPVGEVFLPVYPSAAPTTVRLSVRALISVEGDVLDGEIAPSSGDALWDSLAMAAIRTWHFAPARQGGRAVQAWVRFPVTLRFAELDPLCLAEIVVPTRSLADSIHTLLMHGSDFGTLARECSISPSRVDAGMLGARELKDFPSHVQMAITSVGRGHFTQPLLLGEVYVIFKRLEGPAEALEWKLLGRRLHRG